MKVTIELTDAQVKGLKAYLKEVSSEINPVITKKEICEEIKGMVGSQLQSGAVWDYIIQFESK